MKLLLTLLLVVPLICDPFNKYPYWRNGCYYIDEGIVMCTRSLAEGEDQKLSKRLLGAESGENTPFRRESGAGVESDMEWVPEA